MKKHSSGNMRYIAIAVSFGVICLAFVIILLVIQLKGTTLPEREEGYTRTYTVPGGRGEIYDRNGVKLVGNSDKYDLIYEYGAMPDTRREVNRSLLDVMAAIRSTGNAPCISDDLFVLEGTYPEMTFTSEVSDKESSEYYHYKKFLDRQKMKEGNTTAEDVAAYFVKRYKLYTTSYTNEEITDLIRLYYEMERADFGQYASYTVAEGINKELIIRIEESNIEGVNFAIHPERVYLYPAYASHILGRLGKITADTAEYYLSQGYPLDALVGTSGCEQAFEEYLRGRDGEMVVKYNKDGKMIEKNYNTVPESGHDVYLTIDIELQIAAEDALAENVEMVESSDAGAVTVLDPNSGEVLAVASNPTYDLTRFDSIAYYNTLLADGNQPLYNRALQGVYAPGSTYKMGVALAALEAGLIDEKDTYICNKYYENDRTHTCLDSHGELNVIEAIQHSCNIFFYNLGEKMGIDAVTKYTKQLGLGAETGLELNNKNGIVAGREYREAIGGRTWSLGDDLNAAIGQSDHGYTPMQLSVYISSLVNGGTRYGTRLLHSVRSFYTGEMIYQPSTEVKYALNGEEYSKETQDILKEAMGKVVTESGSVSPYFENVGVSVGGKTGTAEVTGKRDYAIFCGFAPIEEPKIVVSCVLEEGVYGNRAAYTVGKVMEKYFENKE